MSDIQLDNIKSEIAAHIDKVIDAENELAEYITTKIERLYERSRELVEEVIKLTNKKG